MDNKKKNKIFTIIVWCVFGMIVLPLLIGSLSIAIQNNTNKKTVPSIFGYMPMIITNGSMEPVIKVGDIIFSKACDVKSINDGDIISYWDPTNSNKIITHKVDSINEKDGKRYFTTYGVFTGSLDTSVVPEENVLGVYTFKIPVIGNLMLFAQTPQGLVMFLLVPLGGVLVYDTIRRQNKEDKKDAEIKALKEELENLKNNTSK